MRYNVAGDPGAWVNLPNEFMASTTWPPPMPCVSLTSTLLRDRQDVISDLVELHWVKDPVSPGTGIEIFVTDFVGKKHAVYTSNGIETSVRLENISRFVVQDDGPAVARPYRFHIVATNLSAKSSETYASPINITTKVKAVVPPTPDEIAGTARDVLYAVLKAEVFADVLTALGALPTEGQAIVNSALDSTPAAASRTWWPRAAAWTSATSASSPPSGPASAWAATRATASRSSPPLTAAWALPPPPASRPAPRPAPS